MGERHKVMLKRCPRVALKVAPEVRTQKSVYTVNASPHNNKQTDKVKEDTSNTRRREGLERGLEHRYKM